MALHLGVEGVATATLISQAAGFVVGLYFILKKLPVSKLTALLLGIFEGVAMKRLATVNSDLFIRTACLLAMTNIFVAKGSAMGADILAANAILFQIQYLIAYLFDGLANAVSVFAGKFVGKENLKGFMETRTIADKNMLGLGILLICGLLLFTEPLLMLFTDLEQVLNLCKRFSFYLILFIVAMAPGLVYSGFYIGATCSVPIRNSLVAALVFFIPLELLLIPRFQNHGLWSSFIVFSAMRSLVLYLYWNRMVNQNFVKKDELSYHR
jgi:MATE family multidrug resistance protein